MAGRGGNGRRWLLVALVVGVLVGASGCAQVRGLIEGLLGAEATVVPEPTGRIQAYFTVGSTPSGGPDHVEEMDALLVAAIDGAQRSVDIAAFDLELQSVVDALARAHRRGVAVRLVTDDTYEEELGPTVLEAAGVPVVLDMRSPYMHNKFVVIDGYQVWTGSWNLTDNGTDRNNNNVVVLTSRNLAQNYIREFEEMFVHDAFGVTSPDDTPHPQVALDGVRVETYFEAEGDVRTRILELLEGAETGVLFMAFVFTDDDIARAMIQRHRDGVVVRGVIEARQAENTGGDFTAMRTAGVDVLKDGNPYIMHHKVIVIDEQLVVTGSYNFTASAADRNDENVVIVHSPDIAAQYRAEFERVYSQAEEAP